MSLAVWLPLTKDLRNQGLNGAAVSNNGATYSATGGKLGGCYNFNNNYCAVDISLGVTASITCWTKTSTDGKMSWVLEDDTYGYLNLFESSIYTLNAGDGNNNPFKTDSNSNISCLHDGQWHHFVVTFGNSVAKLYIDGEYQGTAQTFRNPTTTNKRIKIGGYYKNAHSYSWNGAINDFRVYDHCLSPMEVKQISQGLVLHYPLNRNGWGQENFILESHKVTSGGQASGITRTYESDGSIKIVSTSGNGSWCSLGFAKDSNTSVGSNMTIGNTYCISCDIKVETGTALPTLFINGGNGYKQLKPVNGSIVTNKWMRIYYTSTWADPGTQYGNISLHLGFSGAIGTYYFKNFKLEKGSIPTSWCPNSSDALATTMGLNSTTEYDCSGFCNNGTRSGTFSWTSDTSKYEVSTIFNGTEQISATTPKAEILTLSCWAKTSKNKSTSQFMIADSTSEMCISLYSGCVIGFFKVSSTQGTGSRCTLGSAYKENDWNHFVVVKTGAETRKIYCNGVEQTATSNDYWSAVTGFFISGRNSSKALPFYGEICDVRAYATALSASDVQSLYQNSAYIDNNGNVYGAVHSEV